MPTALSTINIAKEQAATYSPLLLYTFTWPDATVLRLSSAPLNSAEGGFQYGGNDYLARIREQDIAVVQELAEGGIDIAPSVTLTLADADQYLWTNYERAKGFKGATVEARFVFWSADTSTFSSDSVLRFSGICGPANSNESTLEITATSKLALQRTMLPVIAIQRRCPNNFPSTAAERADGANNPDSPFWACGYSPDVSVTGVGNYQSGSTPYTSCAYTKEACIARLGDVSRVPPYNATSNKPPIQADTSGRSTGRFAGIAYEPPAGGRVREYVSGQWLDVKNSSNDAKYGDYYPFIYGTGWVEPPVMWTALDGNYTRGECVVAVGECDQILEVVVNDTRLTAATQMDGTPYTYANADLRYHVINRGDRNGSPNLDAPALGNGDPYGSLCAIYWVVSSRVHNTSDAPRVRVLVRGPKVRVYTDATTYTMEYSSNPVWILLDLLTWGKLRYSDIDIASFVTAAAFASASVTYTNENAASATHARYAANLIIRQRRALSEIIRGVRQSCGAILQPNRESGKLHILMKSTLAQQQPATVDGSNYNTAIASKLPNGTTQNGYAAYRFDLSTILKGSNGELKFRLFQRAPSETPNRINFQFQDEAYNYASSAFSLVETVDVARIDEEFAQSLQVDGVPNFDQAARIGKQLLAELHRGNSRGDTGGTLFAELETSFRGVRLNVGQLVVVNLAKKSLTNQLFRIVKIRRSANFETATITLQWHSDDWYLDSYGQQADPLYAGGRAAALDRPPYPWRPNKVAPQSGDPLYGSTERSFLVEQRYETLADGSAGAVLRITGARPVNRFATMKAPLIGLQGTTATTGGTLAGGRVYYMQIVATNASGSSAPSTTCSVSVGTATNTNTVTVAVTSWDSAATGYRVYLGESPNTMTLAASASGTPSSITLTALAAGARIVPDSAAHILRASARRVAHAGVLGATASTVATNSLTIAGAAFTTDQFVGYDVAVVAAESGTQAVPWRNYRVTANTADVLTVTPDPAGEVTDGSIVVMRSKATVSSDGLTLTDANWVNSYGPSGLTSSDEIGRVVRILSGPGAGQARAIRAATSTSVTVESPWEIKPTSDSRYIIEEPGIVAVAESVPIANVTDGDEMYLDVPVQNYERQVLSILPEIVDSVGLASVESLAPVRDVYVWGSPGTINGAPVHEPN